MHIAIIGAGNFGTAIAYAMSQAKHDVVIYDVTKSRIDDINLNHRNSEVFPNFRLPENIRAHWGADEYLATCDLVALVVSARTIPMVLNEINSYITKDSVILSLTKGFAPNSGSTLDVLVFEMLSKLKYFGVATGPTFAAEMIKDDPSKMIVGTDSDLVFNRVVEAFQGGPVRLSRSKDVLGLELCAAIKNVVAIALGIHVELGFGQNSRFNLLTQAVQEIHNLVLAAGGHRETILSAGGIGDLLMTSTTGASRNYYFGGLIAQGLTIEQALNKIGSTVEGLDSIKPTKTLAAKYGIEMPIVSAVHQIIFEKANIKKTITDLIEKI